MTNIQALRERRHTRAKELNDLLNANPGNKWNADLQAKYDQGMSEIAEVDGEMDRHAALAARIADEAMRADVAHAADRHAHDKKSPASSLFAKWVRGGDNALSAEEWAGIRATMSTTTPAEGGYSVQSDVASTLIEMLKDFGAVRRVAEVFTTEQGNPLSFPTSDGTSETGELIAENTTANAADPVFGTVALNAYKFSSKIVAAPFELLQDSTVDIEAFIGRRLMERVGRAQNTYFTTGTGTSQPRGIVTGASAGKVGTTGQTLTVIFDDLVDLVHSIDPAYRAGGNCKWMLNDSSLKVIRKLKDATNNRPLFIPGYELNNSMPDTLLGYEVVVNGDVAAMAASAKSIIFGDLSKYKVRDVMSATMFRFSDSAYAKLGQVGFLMWARSGGNLVDTTAVKYYQNSAT